MNAYFAAVALLYNGCIEPSAAIIFSEQTDPTAIRQEILRFVDPGYMLIDMRISELQDDVLKQLAQLAKEKGLV